MKIKLPDNERDPLLIPNNNHKYNNTNSDRISGLGPNNYKSILFLTEEETVCQRRQQSIVET